MIFQKQTAYRAAAVLAIAVAVWAGSARATDFVWDTAAGGQPVAGGDGSWNVANSWTADNGVTKTNWINIAASNAIFGAPAGTVALSSSSTVVGALTFNAAGYKIRTFSNTLTLNAGGTVGTGLVDFNGSGTLALKNDLATAFNIDAQAIDANGRITAVQSVSGAADTALTLGNISIAATRTLTFDGGNNYRVFTGDVASGGTLQVSSLTGTTSAFNGVFVAGAYAGAGSGASATDAITLYRSTVSGGANFNVATDGSDVNGQGGVFFSGGGTRNVGNLKIAYSARYGGAFGAVDGEVVHITSSYAQYTNYSDALVLLVRNGGQIVFDPAITYLTGNTGTGLTLQTQLSGDGHPANAIDFGVGAANPYGGNLDLGKYVSANGTLPGYSNGSLVVGGLNLITHSGTFTNTKGINFLAIDDDGEKYGDITKTTGAGWTIKDNPMTVTSSGGTIVFSNSRSLDIQAGDSAASGLNIQSPITIAAGKSLYKWGPNTLTIDSTSTVNNSGLAGTLCAREGTTLIRTSTFNADLVAGGGSVTTAGPVVSSTAASVYVPGASIGGSLTVTVGGCLHPSAGADTQTLNVAGNVILQNDAEFDFNFNAAAHDAISGQSLTINPAGSYTLNPNILAAVPADHYALIIGTAFTGGLGTWSITGHPAGWTIVKNGNEIDLVVSAASPLPCGAGTWKNGSGDGKWTTNSGAENNWLTACPGGAGDSATFDDNVAGGTPGTVELDGPKTVGEIILSTTSSPQGYTLGCPGAADSLTLQAASGHARLSALGNQHHTLNAPVVTASDADISVSGSAGLDLAGGLTNSHALTLACAATATLHAGAITGSGDTAVAADSAVSAASIRQHSLALAAGSTLRIAPTDTPNAAGSTSILASAPALAGSTGTWTSQLDLANNSLIIQGGGAAALATVANQIHQGLFTDAANHNGITSSTALSSAATPDQDTTLGYALAGEISTSSFAGQSVDPTDVLIKYTWKADANLDGIVNVADLGILATHYGHTTGVDWATADFNGDNIVNVADLGLLATYYGRGTGTSQPLMSFQTALAMFPQFGPSGGGGETGSAPEPATLGLLGLAALGLLPRRRTRGWPDRDSASQTAAAAPYAPGSSPPA